MKKYFGRVNHIYFTEPTKQTATACVDHIKTCSDLICVDDMVFQIAVQLFVNVDRKLYFNIDIKKKSATPDGVTSSEIQVSIRGDATLDMGSSFKDDVTVADAEKSSQFTMPYEDEVNDDRLVRRLHNFESQ